MAISCAIQLSAINNGLKAEGALVFVPIKSAFNVAQVSLASTTYFETLDTMGGLQTARYLLGLSLVIFGVLLITLRPDTEHGEDEKQSQQQASTEVSSDSTNVKPDTNLRTRDHSISYAARQTQAKHTVSRELVENPLL